MSRMVKDNVSAKHVILQYKVVGFSWGGIARYMIVAAESLMPCISASVYEAAYSKGGRRFKSSIKTIFYHVAYLFTWASSHGFDLERMLLEGRGIDYKNVRRFARWLEKVISPPIDGEQINGYVSKVLQSSSVFCTWFVENYTPLIAINYVENIDYIKIIESHKKVWALATVIKRHDPIAKDLSDGELEKVNEFFKQRLAKSDKTYGLHLRNYIMWKLIRSFGLRIGEVLAIRLEDLNLAGANPSLEIVRIDERGAGYSDPRTPNNPLVKTFGRLLYFSSEDDELIEFIEDYICKYRVKRSKDSIGRTFFLDHDFLLVTHNCAKLGRALSCSAASKISRLVSTECAFHFHWHLVRHAVFNRLYEAESLIANNATELDHIVYVGGWSSPSSLKIYARRAIRDKSKQSLIRINQAGVINDDRD